MKGKEQKEEKEAQESTEETVIENHLLSPKKSNHPLPLPMLKQLLIFSPIFARSLYISFILSTHLRSDRQSDGQTNMT